MTTAARPGSTSVFVRRFLSDYTRNPVNLLLLAVVPVIFVVVAAGSLSNAAKLLDGVGGPAVETATAGWAAAFLAGIAMYFQIAASRETDRRVVVAGLPPGRLVLARLLTGLTLAAVAGTAALVALAARHGIDHPVRIIAGTLMFALIYVAIGAVVGSLSANPVNGTVTVLFIWILDVFFGPAMGAADRLSTRALPTHFVTMWMVDLPGQHGGRIGDLGWAMAWTAGAVLVAWLVVARRLRSLQRSRRHSRLSAQSLAAASAVWRDARRNRVQWVLLAVVPLVFIITADAVTPDKPITLTLREHGAQLARVIRMPAVHGATMAPIAIASLAALIGLFVMFDSREGDRRAVLAGLRPRALLTARLTVLGGLAGLAAVVSLATTRFVFDATNWPVYAGANVLVAMTYVLVGALLGPLFGRVGGVFIAFLLPFLDLGIVQSPMLHQTPTTGSRFLPGYGGSRVLLDGALTQGFDEPAALVIGLTWLVALAFAVTAVFRGSVRIARGAPT